MSTTQTFAAFFVSTDDIGIEFFQDAGEVASVELDDVMAVYPGLGIVDREINPFDGVVTFSRHDGKAVLKVETA